MDLTLFGNLPWTSWLWAIGAVLVIGIAKSGFGGGVGILAVPMFVTAMGPKIGLGAMLPLLIVADCFSVYHHWGNSDRRNLGVLMPGTLIGIAVGSGLLAWMLGRLGPSPSENTGALDSAEQLLRTAIGIVCILYVLANLVRARFASGWRWNANWITGTIAGSAVGVVSTLAHAAGPVAAIYFLGQHLPKRPFIGTTVAYFLIVNTIKIVPYALLGMIDPATLRYGLWLLPFVPLGTWIGARLNRVMSEDFFRGVIMVLVLMTGLQMVLR